MRLVHLLCGLAFLATGTTGLSTGTDLPDGLYAEFQTPRGDFVIALKHREVPLTVASFVGLAEGTIAPRDGKPFFTGLKWYRVVPGFVIQSGDPDHEKNADKEDAGHPYTFPDEFVPGLHHRNVGVLSMANAGPDTNSCEFFLTLGDCTRLNYLHSVFGEIVSGADVLPQIQQGDAFSIRIRRIGAEARAFQADQAAFDARVARAKKYSGATEPGPAAHFEDVAGLLPTDPPRARNFNFKLANYERATGLKIVARILPSAPTAAEDAVPGAYMRTLAKKLGLADQGVLVVYFADEQDWRVWFGDQLLPALLGRPLAKDDAGDGGAVHDAKTRLIDAALAEGNEAFVRQRQSAPAGGPPHPGQNVKLQTDALLDALLLHFEPKP